MGVQEKADRNGEAGWMEYKGPVSKRRPRSPSESSALWVTACLLRPAPALDYTLTHSHAHTPEHQGIQERTEILQRGHIHIVLG